MHNVMQTLDSKNYMDHNMEYDSVICTRKYPVKKKPHYLFLDRYWRLVIQMTILNFVEILDFKFFFIQHSERQVISSQNVLNMAMQVNSQQMQSTNPLAKKEDQQNFQAAPVWSPPPQTAAAPPLRSTFPAQGNQQPGMWAGTVTSPPGQLLSRSFAAGGIVTQGGMHMTNTHGMINPQMPGRSAFPTPGYGYGGMTATGAFTRDAGVPLGTQGFPLPPPPPPPAMGSTSSEVGIDLCCI